MRSHVPRHDAVRRTVPFIMKRSRPVFGRVRVERASENVSERPFGDSNVVFFARLSDVSAKTAVFFAERRPHALRSFCAPSPAPSLDERRLPISRTVRVYRSFRNAGSAPAMVSLSIRRRIILWRALRGGAGHEPQPAINGGEATVARPPRASRATGLPSVESSSVLF